MPAHDGPHDLREFYAGNRRGFWFLVVLFQIGYVAAGFYFLAGDMGKLPSMVVALLIAQMAAPLVLALVLVSTTSRIVHYIGVGLLFVLVLLHYGRATIN